LAQWIAAFVGENARENYEITRATGDFWVTSSRTPIRKSTSGDKVLLYISEEGFVGVAEAATGARAPYGGAKWAGGIPAQGISLRGIRRFTSPVLYKFPRKGPHPTLGFHPFTLTGGFTNISEEGLQDVLLQAAPSNGEPGCVSKNTDRVTARPSLKVAEAPSEISAENKVREKRVAGQYAMGEGRKRTTLWKLAEAGAFAINWKDAEKYAKSKRRDAERTWIAGGRGEEKVGAELEGLREHGFYIFHDVQLPGLGNVDHVALGPCGFFAIETKSHGGKVRVSGGEILRNGRPFEKDFVSQSWSGCCRLKEILDAQVIPLLCFTDAFVEGRTFVRGVRVLPLPWIKAGILEHKMSHDSRTIAQAVNALGDATGCFPSAVPRPKS